MNEIQPASETGRDHLKGFSLLELLVALAITGLCLALAATSFSAVFRAHTRARENMELLQVTDQTLERIRGLLQAAYLSPHPLNQIVNTFESIDDDSSSQPYDAITFSTLAHKSHRFNAKESDLAEITIFTVEEPKLETPDGDLNLHRLRIRAGGEINDRFEVEGGQVYTLADHVTQLLIEYLDQEGEWKDEWIPGDHIVNNDPCLPCAVRITLGLRTETLDERLSSIMVPMEMTRYRCQFDDENVFDK